MGDVHKYGRLPSNITARESRALLERSRTLRLRAADALVTSRTLRDQTAALAERLAEYMRAAGR